VNIVTTTEPGVILRLTREAAGLSLATLARRTYYSKGYLARVETGQRKATPAIIQAYQDALGDDVNRRQLLMALLAGAGTPLASVEAIGRAFEFALDSPALTVDDWLAKLDGYGHDYMAMGAGEMQARLAADLVRLQTRLDHPVLSAVAAKLLTVHGKTMPSADGRRMGAIRWYRLGINAADRSEDTGVRVWVRGRAALALAYEGAELPIAQDFANQALALSEQPSLGRLNALLALAHAEGLNGDRSGAIATLNDAQRTFDRIGSEEQVSDFAIPEWRMATITSMLASRLGEERLALEAQGTADRTRPATLPRFATHIELHRGLMMAKSGSREEGRAYARGALAKLPPERHSLSLRLMMSEIESA
jgi:transcriptional regulator with XRE-family HTH domain